MKLLLFVLVAFLYFPVYSQTYTKNIIYENDVITKCEYIESYENGLVAQKKYITAKKGYEEMDKEDLFMRGISRQKIDSVITYYYNENWELDRKEISKTSNDFPYILQDQKLIIVGERFIQLKGKYNSVAQLEIELENTISKTRVFNISIEIGNNIINEKIKLIPFQSTLFTTDILLNQGIHHSKIFIYKNDELIEEIILETIGYDIIDNNIYSNKNEAINNPISLNNELVFIDNHGNERFIQIKTENEIFNFTIKNINSIDLSEFNNGSHILEIVDLGTGQRKYCGIQLER